MLRATLTTATLTTMMLFVTASTAQAQYNYGYGFNTARGYGPSYGYNADAYRYPRATFDDYVGDRLRQRRIQQYYGTPYYPQYDNSYYGRQRAKSYLYRPNYDGRLFRSRHDDHHHHDDFDDRLDDFRDRDFRYRFGY